MSGNISSGIITYKQIAEASGIAVSHLNRDTIWINNDSGNKPSLYAVNSEGKHLATLNIKGANNHDWEDLAAFEHKGQQYLLIADVGDNGAKRHNYHLHVIREPELGKVPESKTLSVRPEWSITFNYEDGARDCESVAVDITRQKVILLTKRDMPPVLYELPLKEGKQQVAKRLGEIKPLPEPSESRFSLMGLLNLTTLPTAMDISPDGRSAVVLTYASAYYFSADQATDWLKVFSSTPEEIVLPELRQAESVGFTKDGKSIYVTSEKIPAPLLKVELGHQI